MANALNAGITNFTALHGLYNIPWLETWADAATQGNSAPTLQARKTSALQAKTEAVIDELVKAAEAVDKEGRAQMSADASVRHTFPFTCRPFALVFSFLKLSCSGCPLGVVVHKRYLERGPNKPPAPTLSRGSPDPRGPRVPLPLRAGHRSRRVQPLPQQQRPQHPLSAGTARESYLLGRGHRTAPGSDEVGGFALAQ